MAVCRLFLTFILALQVSTSFSSTDIQQKLTQLENTLKKTELALKQLKELPIKKNKNQTSSRYSLFEKDFTRYPENPYPAYFSISNDDASREIELHGWFQGDQDIFSDVLGLTINNGTSSVAIVNKNTIDRLWIRRIRPSVEGKIYNYFNFYFNADFGQDQIRLFDAFGDINYWRVLGLQFGQQMSLVSGIENYFNNFSYLSRAFTQENSYSAMLAPDREFGYVLHGSLGPSGKEPYFRGLSYLGFDDFFSYQIGLFTGTPDYSEPGTVPVDFINFANIITSLSNTSFEGRLFLNPFINQEHFILQHLGFGFSGSSERANRNAESFQYIEIGRFSTLPAILSIGQNPVFIYQSSVVDKGPRSRLHPQAVWSYGPIGILADWTQTLQNLERLNVGVTLLLEKTLEQKTQRQLNKASQIQIIYNITQEEFNLFHLIPNQNFHLWDKHALGAFQAVFRVSTLNMDGNVFNDYRLSTLNMDGYDPNLKLLTYTFSDPRVSIRKATTWSIGLNWYWTQNLRISAEYDQTQFIGGCSSDAMDPNLNPTPGCITGIFLTPESQVMNRPPERIFMSRFQVTF